MYKIFRRLLFLFPPESIHYLSMNFLRFLCSSSVIRNIITSIFSPKKTPVTNKVNLKFRNRIGLGAGFDKNAKYLRELETLGFGFVEVGTVTPLAQTGNEKPRLFRLEKDQALINRMGFNNDGVKLIAERLKTFRKKYPSSQLIIGGNIGKNKSTPNEIAWKDFVACFNELHSSVDYFVVNVSSPNTPGLRELQEKEPLRKILQQLQMINNGKAFARPIFLKIAPDLSREQIDDVIDLAMEIKLDGLVATNTTISRGGLKTPQIKLQKIGNGGLSGAPLKNTSTEIVRYIYSSTGGQIPIIASGGIFTASDAKEKFSAGASLVQVWTGFIYEGPGIVRKISKKL